MPDVFLHISSTSVFLQRAASRSAFEHQRRRRFVAVVMARIAKDMGLVFENNNVSVMFTDVYVANTLKEQALELARAANFPSILMTRCWR